MRVLRGQNKEKKESRRKTRSKEAKQRNEGRRVEEKKEEVEEGNVCAHICTPMNFILSFNRPADVTPTANVVSISLSNSISTVFRS